MTDPGRDVSSTSGGRQPPEAPAPPGADAPRSEAAKDRFPSHGRLIGADYGNVRIGLAVCDANRRIASPLDTYTRRSTDQDAAFFRKLAAAESAVGFVVGLPLMTRSGDEGTQAKECRAFGSWLGQVTGLPVIYHDERYTTSYAEDALWGAGLSHKKRRTRRDRVAAQLILQAFLDAGGAVGPSSSELGS